MWRRCPALELVDTENLDTSGVVTMEGMFNMHNMDGNTTVYTPDGNHVLRTLDVENWNTGKVENMSYLFGGCKTLEGAAIGGWDVSSLKDASYMFSGALRSGDFDLSGWNTSNLRNVAHMFDTYYRGITLKGISSWNRKNLIGYETRYESFAPWGIIVDDEDWQVWFKKS